MDNNDETDEISCSNKNIIATITHDLKNPAIAQIRALELLLKGSFGEINDSQRNFIKDILNSSNNMLNMLINMLWLYKFDSKKIAVNFSYFNINDVIQEIFTENKLILNYKNQKFEIYVNNENPYIYADKMHIKRIISNLLINAVFHGKELSVIHIYTDLENENFVFKVVNQGEYISEEKFKYIFDINKVFTEKSNALSTGLGLYLSNSLLQLNGGKIIYSSSRTGENTFGFMLKSPKVQMHKMSAAKLD